MHAKNTYNKINATKQLNRRFLWSLLVMSLIISVTEFIVMRSIQLLNMGNGALSPVEETALDTFLLSIISAPMIWFLVMRPLVVSFTEERRINFEQNRLNNELRSGIDSHALVSIADKKGKIVYVNDKFSQVSGYSKEELLGQDHRIVNSKTHPNAFFQDMWQTIRGGKTWQGIICNRKKSGALYWVDSTITPLMDDDGSPRQYISIRRDITAQKATESHLLVLKQAIEACSDMIVITDRNGLIQYANPALYGFTGWSEDSLIGRNINVFDVPEGDDETLAELREALQNNKSWSGRLLCKRSIKTSESVEDLDSQKYSERFWSHVSISPIVNDDKSILHFVQIFRDITAIVNQEIKENCEKQNTVARLEIANILQTNQPLNERFHAILEIICSITAYDLQRKAITLIYDKAENEFKLFLSYGLFNNEYLTKKLQTISVEVLCRHAHAHKNILFVDNCTCDLYSNENFKRKQDHGHVVTPLVAGDDLLGVLILYATPSPAYDDSHLGMLGHIGELMALAILREQTQLELEKARDLAMKTSQIKSDFLANMSHEIRTPMNGVLGMLEMLTDSGLSPLQWDLVNTAKSSAESLLEIINDILDLSKLEANKIEIETISFDLGALIEEVSGLLAKRAFDKGLELNCFLPANQHKQWIGDPMRIRQILTNLIGNAIKFTEQGEVSVSLEPLGKDGEYHLLRFNIKDTGIGIPANVQKRLFQPFSQAETETSRRFGGTGLGLSICKKLILLMGGTLGLESEPGKGACFWFTLPLLVDEKYQENVSFDFSDKQILIIDDNVTNRRILNSYLSHWGMNIIEADCGQSALDILTASTAKGQHFDLIITDMHMPNMDGMTLAKKITGQTHLAHIPIILLTSGALINEEQKRRYGFNQCLLKPVRQSQLFDAVSNAFNCDLNTENGLADIAHSLPDYQDSKILVIEDNKVNQKVIKGLLAKYKITPVIADNGQIALDLLAKQTFDLIFMDCQMPVMDGYETTTAIRKMEKTNNASTPMIIIALTANAISREKEKCTLVGMDDYISKPIRNNVLNEKLAVWLTKKADAEESTSIVTSTQTQEEDNSLAPIWNEEETLRNLDNDKEILIDMISAFLTEIQELISKLLAAKELNDLSAIASITHAIKGSIACFNADAIVKQAAYLERMARQQESVDFNGLVNNLVTSVATLATILEKYK